jgi:hypothetical protein
MLELFHCSRKIQKLKKENLQKVNGGIKLPIHWAWPVSLGIWIYDNWDDICEGWNSYEPRYIGKE